MGPKAPSTRQILDLSDTMGLELTEAEAATYATLIGAGMPAYRRLEAHVSDAAEHDSQVLDDILDGDNTALGVWADSAYRSAEIEAALKEKGLRSRIHRKGRRNKPLSEREKQGNKTRSSVRVRVEHVFGAQSNDMGGTLVRSVGLVRAKARIGLKNLAYNMRRLVQLERLAAAV